MQEAAGTNLEMKYTGIRQGKVTQWVVMHHILKVCAREKGYEGGRLRRDAWWRQEVAETQLIKTLAEIYQEARRMQSRKRNTQ